MDTGVDLRRKNFKVKGEITKLGGLCNEYSALKDIIAAAYVNASSSLQSGKGVLLHGPPGTGKTSLARLCAHDLSINFFPLNGPEIISQDYGDSERDLNEVFEFAIQARPSVVFIDELDVIAPARKDGVAALYQRMVATLLHLMDGIGKTDGIIVIATTNRLDIIEPALRRRGRFDREIEIGVPSYEQRLDILLVVLSKMQHSLLDSQVQHLAGVTRGFVGSDLAALCNRAAMVCMRRYSTEERCALKVTFEDFEKARMNVRPSAMGEVIIEVPKVKWEDVVGQREVKRQLEEAVVWPQKHQDRFDRIGTRPPTGVLLFGPPGCSKTLMARAVASEARLNFLAVKGPEHLSKWVAEPEKAVISLFAKARANAPSMIFFDEIDFLPVIRGKESDGDSVSSRVVSQLLAEMDVLHQKVEVIVIAATNRPDMIDPALLKPGCFDRLLYVGPPKKIDREEIFRFHSRKTPFSTDVDVGELAELTKGYTWVDIGLILSEAGLNAMEEEGPEEASQISMQQLKCAIELVKPSGNYPYQELPSRFQRLVISSD